MNHHMLLHLKQCVIDHGPLWSSSLFVFEDWNGDIGRFFHGTQYIQDQVQYFFLLGLYARPSKKSQNILSDLILHYLSWYCIGSIQL